MKHENGQSKCFQMYLNRLPDHLNMQLDMQNIKIGPKTRILGPKI